ncbi:Uncharacterised protein [Vibrio cholerae]|nr:Uncharacterised protein [Vibrio cholerae]
MPKQFTFQQFWRNRAAVDWHKRTLATTRFMDAACDQLFARPRFPFNQHRSARRSKLNNALLE